MFDMRVVVPIPAREGNVAAKALARVEAVFGLAGVMVEACHCEELWRQVGVFFLVEGERYFGRPFGASDGRKRCDARVETLHCDWCAPCDAVVLVMGGMEEEIWLS
jgi:hypothetical protein